MTDAELDALYRTALGHSHAAAIRAIFEAGYSEGVSATKVPDVPQPPLWEGRTYEPQPPAWERRISQFGQGAKALGPLDIPGYKENFNG